MKKTIFSIPDRKPWLIYILLSVLLYAFFSIIDLFDLLYTYSRAHEEWELDELFAIIPVIAIIASIAAIKNQLKLKKLNETLEQQVREKSEDLIEQERMLYHQARLASIGEMISMIAHQWRQPLNALSFSMISLNTLTTEEEIDAEEIDSTLTNMEKILQDLSRTINDFMTFYSSKDPGNSIRICQVIENTLKVFKPMLNTHGIRFDNTVSCNESTYLKSSGYKIEQLLSVLVSNSIDAINRSVEETRLMKGEGVIRIGFNSMTDQCNITIEDNGGGIPEEILPRVCEPYFTTKHSSYGTGLGLYMVKMTIERQIGGTLSIQNGKHGALVTITLPIQKNPGKLS